MTCLTLSFHIHGVIRNRLCSHQHWLLHVNKAAGASSIFFWNVHNHCCCKLHLHLWTRSHKVAMTSMCRCTRLSFNAGFVLLSQQPTACIYCDLNVRVNIKTKWFMLNKLILHICRFVSFKARLARISQMLHDAISFGFGLGCQTSPFKGIRKLSMSGISIAAVWTNTLGVHRRCGICASKLAQLPSVWRFGSCQSHAVYIPQNLLYLLSLLLFLNCVLSSKLRPVNPIDVL